MHTISYWPNLLYTFCKPQINEIMLTSRKSNYGKPWLQKENHQTTFKVIEILLYYHQPNQNKLEKYENSPTWITSRSIAFSKMTMHTFMTVVTLSFLSCKCAIFTIQHKGLTTMHFCWTLFKIYFSRLWDILTNLRRQHPWILFYHSLIQNLNDRLYLTHANNKNIQKNHNSNIW